MAKPESKTILVRVPTEIVEAAVKLKEEENLPTIGNAIRFWFEQQKDEGIQSQLSDIKIQLKEIDGIHKSILGVLQHFKKTDSLICDAIHLILGGDHLISKRLRKESKCKECPNIEKPGYLQEIAEGKK